MSSIQNALKAMKSGQSLKAAKDQIEAEVARKKEEAAQAEQARLEAEQRRAEMERSSLIARSIKILAEIFTAMRRGTIEGIQKAQELLGDQYSNNPMDVMRREVLGQALVDKIDGKKAEKKRRAPEQLYGKLHDFLRVSLLGFDHAQRLADACIQGNPEAILKALQFKDNQERGACAAAVAILTNESDWQPSAWADYGLKALEEFQRQAEEVIRLREEAGLEPSANAEESSATVPYSKAS